jgi:hypothetical protein
VLTSTRLRTSSGWRSASSCAIALPIEKPATSALGTASARSSAAGVVCHHAGRERACGQGRAPGPAVVEGGEAIAIGEPVELRLPRFGGVAQPGDEQDVRSGSVALDPKLGVADLYLLAH